MKCPVCGRELLKQRYDCYKCPECGYYATREQLTHEEYIRGLAEAKRSSLWK